MVCVTPRFTSAAITRSTSCSVISQAALPANARNRASTPVPLSIVICENPCATWEPTNASMHSCWTTPGSGAQRAGPSSRWPTAAAPTCPPAPSTTRNLLPAKPAHLHVASKKKAAPHKHCQHLESYGLARTAEIALLPAISTRHERVPRAVAWGEIFGDEIVAVAMIDRLIHHAEILSLKGDTYRLKDRDLGGRPPARERHPA